MDNNMNAQENSKNRVYMNNFVIRWNKILSIICFDSKVAIVDIEWTNVERFRLLETKRKAS